MRTEKSPTRTACRACSNSCISPAELALGASPTEAEVAGAADPLGLASPAISLGCMALLPAATEIGLRHHCFIRAGLNCGDRRLQIQLASTRLAATRRQA